MPSRPDSQRTGSFRTTQWTQVLAARGRDTQAREALSALCQAYYAPVVAYLKRSEPRLPCEDVAHGFFAGLLEGDPFAQLDREGGRFRSYLLGALKHHLSHRRASECRIKRGSGTEHLPLKPPTDTSPGIDPAEVVTLSPDAAFDQAWALALLAHALEALRAEFVREGNAEQFDQLKPWLTGEAGHGAQTEMAKNLGMEPDAFKVRVHRLRQRFRKLVKAEVAATLQPGADVDQELQALQQALAG